MPVADVVSMIEKMTAKYGNPIGTDYEQGVQDHGHRIRAQVLNLAAISTPAQASGEPVAWSWEKWITGDHWSEQLSRTPPNHSLEKPNPSIRNYQALYAHPPAQASETGGEMIGRITQALVRADEEFGNSLSAYRYRKLAEAAAALSAHPPAQASETGGEIARLRTALEETRNRIESWPLDDQETCMCGALIKDHSIGSGHSPVPQADHARSMLLESLNEALSAPGEGEQS